jgi:hypothetical protein
LAACRTAELEAEAEQRTIEAVTAMEEAFREEKNALTEQLTVMQKTLKKQVQHSPRPASAPTCTSQT